MDKPLDSPLKDHNMNRDSNDNIPELLFSVDIKVEKEAETKDDEDWCVDNFAAGNLLEPLFFTQATEPKGVQCSLCFRYFLDRFNIYKHNLTHLQVTIINPACFQCDICNSFFANIKSIERHMPSHNKSITNSLPYKPKAWKYNTDVKLINAYEEFTIKNSIIKTERKLSDGVTNSLSYRPKSGTRLTKRTHQCNICQKAYSYGAWHGHMNEVHGMGNTHVTYVIWSSSAKDI
ncbi:zinc finger protein 770-like [Leguminivora glycinivorella]|uniref:zinc finger protein 770-like n=1 Tax=Leguminivora glycinivorella TaxID=1035111 RepID=UPI00200D4DB4|nr:zinc finger protein 770-like [Leguminivora glycinivorella]